MSFKLRVVSQIENGELTATQAVNTYGIQSRSTVTRWMRKYGNFDWSNKTPYISEDKTPEQQVLELEQENRLLKKQKRGLEKQVEQADRKAIIFDMMMDLAEKEYNIPIRKNSLPG